MNQQNKTTRTTRDGKQYTKVKIKNRKNNNINSPVCIYVCFFMSDF